MLIGFTGTREGMTDFQREELSNLLKLKACTEFMHGDAVGSDEQANYLALGLGIKVFSIHPPDNPHKRAWCFDPEKTTNHNRIITQYKDIDGVQVKWFPVLGYLERNKKIVDSTELLIATPKEFRHTLRSGTWATIRYCWKKKKNLVIIPPVERMETIGVNDVSKSQ